MRVPRVPRCSRTWRGCVGLLLGFAVLSLTALQLSWEAGEDSNRCRLLGPLTADDPYVVNEIRLKYLHEASELSHDHVKRQSSSPSFYVNLSEEFYKRAITELFVKNGITKGYFVEAGALDGVSSSNSLKLETDFDWSGLLIEPDRAMYKLLLQANRIRSLFLNACISPHRYPYQALLRTLSPAVGEGANAVKYKSMTTLVFDRDDRSELGFPSYEQVQCFPISSVLLAAGVSNITLFSLDVEDVEWEILETFPFERVVVDVWFIEHRKLDGRGERTVEYDERFVQWFDQRNYTLYDYEAHNVADYVFVRNAVPWLVSALSQSRRSRSTAPHAPAKQKFSN